MAGRVNRLTAGGSCDILESEACTAEGVQAAQA